MCTLSQLIFIIEEQEVCVTLVRLYCRHIADNPLPLPATAFDTITTGAVTTVGDGANMLQKSRVRPEQL